MKPPYWAVLDFANLTMLVAGMFVDVFSNILILCPLLLRLMEPAGVSELHFGIVATVNSDMGNITPPFGLNLFVASGTFKKSYVEVVRAVVPWLADRHRQPDDHHLCPGDLALAAQAALPGNKIK